MKTCTKCKTSKDLTAFSKDKRNNCGLGTWCKSCKNEQQRVNKYGASWTKNNPEASKAIKDRYVQDNHKTVKNSKAKWSKANPGKEAAKVRKYQASKLNATPAWLTKEQIKEMETFYINRPKGYHVDHIVPLQGKEVCGLHVPWNLQYLPADVNQRKSNK